MRIPYQFLLAICVIMFTQSCVDHTFDEPPGFEPEVVVANGSVGDLLAQWVPESFTEITDDLIISGRVVANDESGNFYKQLVFEDETGGIQIRLDAIGLFNEFPLGRKISVKCQSLWISDYNGLPQLSAVSGSGIDLTSIAIPEPIIPEFVFNSNDSEVVAPNEIEINQNRFDFVNTLVTYKNVQFAVGSAAVPLADPVNQFSRNLDIEDCSENVMLVRTSGFASFAGDFSPSANGTITGVLSVFGGDYQLLLRDFSEIQMEDARCDDNSGTGNNGNTGDAVDKVVEDFESQMDNQDIAIAEWSNIAVKGSRFWRAKEFDNNVYAQATAYNDTADEMEAWLISPNVKFDAPMKLTLKNAIAFHVHDGLSVWYSNDFDGSNVTAATWTEISITTAGGSTDNYAWVDSGEIDLSAITGEAYIGFKYVGNPTNGTTSVILDDIQIVDQ